MDALRKQLQCGERGYLYAAGLFAILGGLCIAAEYAFGIQGDPANGLIGTASLLGVAAAVALTTFGLRAAWHAFGRRGGDLFLFIGIAILVDAALSELAAAASLGIGPASGPDGTLVWGMWAITLAAAGAIILLGDAIWVALRGMRHHEGATTT